LGPLVPFLTTCQSTMAATASTTQVMTCFTVEFTICSYSKAKNSLHRRLIASLILLEVRCGNFSEFRWEVSNFAAHLI
jgi:hypothetical protein